MNYSKELSSILEDIEMNERHLRDKDEIEDLKDIILEFNLLSEKLKIKLMVKEPIKIKDKDFRQFLICGGIIYRTWFLHKLKRNFPPKCVDDKIYFGKNFYVEDNKYFYQENNKKYVFDLEIMGIYDLVNCYPVKFKNVLI